VVEALLLGCLAALCWGCAVLASVPPSRVLGPWPGALWLSLFGATVAIVVALPSGAPAGATSDWAFAIVAGIAYAGAITCYFVAIDGAHISLVTPIIACDGAIAAVAAVLTGAEVTLPIALALGLMVGSLVTIARSRARLTAADTRFVTSRPRPIERSVIVALGCAVCFATVFVTSGKAHGMDALWVVAVSRGVSFLCVLLCVLLLVRPGRMSVPGRRELAWLALAALLDIGGYVAYVYAARAALPVAAVSASQYAAVSAIGAVAAFGERLSRPQIIGVVGLIAGAALIASYAG
jgi:drug/metabolite transporter (DMT)-like permease